MKKIDCNCICHFNSNSPIQTPEGRKMGCGSCDFGQRMSFKKKEYKYDNGKPQVIYAIRNDSLPITDKCLLSHTQK